jgi:hypothetical protein
MLKSDSTLRNLLWLSKNGVESAGNAESIDFDGVVQLIKEVSDRYLP